MNDFNEQTERNDLKYNPIRLLHAHYDIFKSVVSSDGYNVHVIAYDKKNRYIESRPILAYWSYPAMTVEKLTLILYLNPNKMQCGNKKHGSCDIIPLFHVATYTGHEYRNVTFLDLYIHKICDKLRLILQHGYDYHYKDPIENCTILQYYHQKAQKHRLCNNYCSIVSLYCTQSSICAQCRIKRLYLALAQVVQECWIKDVTLFDMTLNHCDITDKKQRRK